MCCKCRGGDQKPDTIVNRTICILMCASPMNNVMLRRNIDLGLDSDSLILKVAFVNIVSCK